MIGKLFMVDLFPRVRRRIKISFSRSAYSYNYTSRVGDKQLYRCMYFYRLLREKSALDEDFVAFCVQRKGAAKNSLQHIIDLPVSAFYKYYIIVFTSSVFGGEKNVIFVMIYSDTTFSDRR